MAASPPDKAPVSDQPVIVALARRPAPVADQGPELLEEAVARAGMWESLSRAARGRRPRFRVLLAPSVSASADPATSVDRSIVETLIDLLRARGYRHVAVALSDWSLVPSQARRPAGEIAQCLGYSGVTKKGSTYELADPTQDVVPAGFPADSALRGTGLARSWLEAGFRINIAKNVTHPEFGYALCLANLFGVLPETDRHHYYQACRDPGEVIAGLLRHSPPSFHIVDAVTSSHGYAGALTARPLRTNTVIATSDALLADVAGATLMGADPASSPLARHALREIGLPPAWTVDGDLVPYSGWRNPPSSLLGTSRLLTGGGAARRVFSAASVAAPQSQGGPAGDPALARLSATLTSLNQAATDNPFAAGALWWLLSSAGAAEAMARSWRTIFAKDAIHRRDTSLGLDLAAYEEADYDTVASYVDTFEGMINGTPADASGMRWRSLDDTVLFACERTIAAPYAEFVARVDVSQAIRFMADYLGGCVVAVSRDAAGRVTRQAERNVYLPQPNYLALFGGDVIDVCKLETMRYTGASQRICWRTVHSPNASAAYDDGSVLFCSADGGTRTRIVVHTRQQFTLPLFWQVVNLDNWPDLKDALTRGAYYRFFTATLDNFEACYEGRDFRIGRDWDDRAAQLPTEQVSGLAAVAGMARQRLKERVRHWMTAPQPERTDSHGFRHFPPAPTGRRAAARADRVAPLRPHVAQFVRELRQAAERDLNSWQRR